MIDPRYLEATTAFDTTARTLARALRLYFERSSRDFAWLAWEHGRDAQHKERRIHRYIVRGLSEPDWGGVFRRPQAERIWVRLWLDDGDGGPVLRFAIWTDRKRVAAWLRDSFRGRLGEPWSLSDTPARVATADARLTGMTVQDTVEWLSARTREYSNVSEQIDWTTAPKARSFLRRLRDLPSEWTAFAGVLGESMAIAARYDPRPLAGLSNAEQYAEAIPVTRGLIEATSAVRVRTKSGSVTVGSDAWQDVHDAISEDNGPLWLDVKHLLERFGLALPAHGYSAMPNLVSLARGAVDAAASILTDATTRAGDLRTWLDKYRGRDVVQKRERIRRELIDELARASRLVVWRSKVPSWVYVNAGWFRLGAGLRLGVVIETDPAKRALREVVLRGATGLPDVWQRDERAWQAVAAWAPERLTISATDWILERLSELESAGLLEGADRWGRPLDGPRPPITGFPKGHRQAEHVAWRTASPDLGDELGEDELSPSLPGDAPTPPEGGDTPLL